MEVDLQKVTAAPGMFQSKGGREFMVHPLSFRDWGTIEGWMRERVISSIKGAVRDPDLSTAEKQLIIREATKEAMKINMRSPEARVGLLDSLEGSFRMVFLSLRRGLPKLTLDGLEEIIGQDTVLLGELSQRAFTLSFPQMRDFLEAAEKKEDEENPPEQKEQEAGGP